tara:strand:+ start:513 stop:794 length:282 start_codon:yes stop_codon:yes gene_type:complete
MVKEIKVDENTIKEVKDLRNEINKIMFDFGNLKLEKINLDQRLKDLEKLESDMTAKYKGNMTKEKKIADKLKEKHGDGYVNLDNGTFVASGKN